MSTYQDYADSVSRILESKGASQARAKEQGGQLWGSTIANLGQVIPQQVQQAIAQNAAKRKTAQIQSIIQQHGGDLDKSLPLIMGVDATIGQHLADEHAKVQKSVAEVQEIQNKAKKEQLDFSDRLWSGVTDEGSYARAALVSHSLGEQVPDQYDPEWVKQKKQSLLSMKDQLDLNKPINVPRGGTLVTPQGTVLAQGQDIPAPQPTPAGLAMQASGGDAGAALDRLNQPKPISPAQQAEIDRQNASLAEQARHNKVSEATQLYRAQHPASAAAVGSLSDVQETIKGMKEGTIPPQLPGRASKEYTAMMAEAHRQGYDLAGAVTDWMATQKHIATLNNAQQTRLQQSINQLPDLLDSVDSLASKWKAGRFPLLNKASLALAKGGAYGKEAASIANQLDAQIADVTADLGAVYMGGNSPTDHALGLAAKALDSNWDEKVLHDMVKLAKQNVQTRENSIRNTGVQGASPNNPYVPPQSAPAKDPLGIR